MVTADVVIRFCTYISSLQKMTDLVACEGSPCYPKSDKSLKAFPLPIGGGGGGVRALFFMQRVKNRARPVYWWINQQADIICLY